MWPLLFLCPLALSGCDSYRYRSARFFDGTQHYGRALEQYEAFLQSGPSGPRAVLAHMRSGEIETRYFQRCLEARRHFEAAARLTPVASAENERARAALLTCPDYFPIEPGRSWTFGDSVSGGRAARIEWRVDVSTDGAVRDVSQILFAGSRTIKDVKARYERQDWMVWELSEGRRRPILRYPFHTGESWKTGRGSDEERFTIVDESATARTAAGTFAGCLKVRDYRPSFSSSWTYDYYAPFVGKVKTTLGGLGFENPNVELLKYTD